MKQGRQRAVASFSSLVWRANKLIPAGKVATYGQLAVSIGCPDAARAVGNALNKNPFAPQAPCHRVVRSDGGVGGFAGGQKVKIKLLKNEGVKIINQKIDLSRFLFQF